MGSLVKTGSLSFKHGLGPYPSTAKLFRAGIEGTIAGLQQAFRWCLLACKYTEGNAASGQINIADGDTSFFGAVTNSGSITITGTAAAVCHANFYSYVNNAGGSIKTTSALVRFLAGCSIGGSYTSDPSTQYFANLTITPGGVLSGGAGDVFDIYGPFSSAGTMNLGDGSTTLVEHGGDLVETGGLLSLGNSATLTVGTVQVTGGRISAAGPTAKIIGSLEYRSPLDSTFAGSITGPGNTLAVNCPSARLTLSGSNTYTGGTTVLGGTLDIENAFGLPGNSTLAIANTAEVIFATDLGSAVQLSLMLPGAGGSEPGMTYFHVTTNPASVPEPGTLVLLAAAAMIGVVAVRRKGLPSYRSSRD
jgi:fibronectin-binding autotransporter adhesin